MSLTKDLSPQNRTPYKSNMDFQYWKLMAYVLEADPWKVMFGNRWAGRTSIWNGTHLIMETSKIFDCPRNQFGYRISYHTTVRIMRLRILIIWKRMWLFTMMEVALGFLLCIWGHIVSQAKMRTLKHVRSNLGAGASMDWRWISLWINRRQI